MDLTPGSSGVIAKIRLSIFMEEMEDEEGWSLGDLCIWRSCCFAEVQHLCYHKTTLLKKGAKRGERCFHSIEGKKRKEPLDPQTQRIMKVQWLFLAPPLLQMAHQRRHFCCLCGRKFESSFVDDEWPGPLP